MPSPESNSTPRMTLATVASLIIDDEYMARARAKTETLDGEELRDLVRRGVAEQAKFYTRRASPGLSARSRDHAAPGDD